MTQSSGTSLVTIIALARSGALDRARQLFHEAGLDAVTDDPATLSVRGRLLKDEGRRATTANRDRLWREAGDAYARAADLSGMTYHLINAATLALLSGDHPTAAERARLVLGKLDAGETGPETPYFLAATRAEALLLLGQTREAEAALTEAVRLAPEAWEDHASTLRQFVLVLDVLKQDASWLKPLQPPRSLHFAGPLALDDDVGLRTRIDAVLAQERIGFAYGALAGGADVIVSEAALTRDAELHLILPAPPAVFRAESAAPLGGDWPGRFDAVLERATTVSVVDARMTATTMLHVRLAAEVAMGKAVMNAATIASEAVQLLLVRPQAETGATSTIAEHWQRSGRRQIQLDVPMTPAALGQAKLLPEKPDDGVRAAMLAVAFDTEDADNLERVAAVLANMAAPIATPVVGGNTLHLAFTDPTAAAGAASLIGGAFSNGGVRIAGHYGIAGLIQTPFGSGRAVIGPATVLASDILASVPTGAIHLSETFAAALNGWTATGGYETSYVGDLTLGLDTMALYALTPTGR